MLRKSLLSISIVRHNPVHPSPYIRACSAGNPCQTPSKTKSANFQYARRINTGIAYHIDCGLIASLFPIIEQTTIEPPDQRMKPERATEQHVEIADQIVMAF